MLGVIPIQRRNAFTVITSALWNLIVLTPFVIAFWIFTKRNNVPDEERNCHGIPWDVANFARWAFLGFAAYTIFAIPVNIINIRRQEKFHGYKTNHWLQMFDALHWLANWALFFHLVTALANRHQCDNHNITSLLWATVFISVAFAVAGIIFAIASFASYLVNIINDFEREGIFRFDKGISQLQNQGAVEVMDIRKSTAQTGGIVGNNRRIEQDPVRAAQMKGDDYERRRIDLEGDPRDRVHDKMHGAEEERHARDARRDQHEAVNIRDDARREVDIRDDVRRERRQIREEYTSERTDYRDDHRTSDARNVRNLEAQGSQFQSKY